MKDTCKKKKKQNGSGGLARREEVKEEEIDGVGLSINAKPLSVFLEA